MLSPKDIGLSYTNGVFFIAEAGINHNGCLEKAKELIDFMKKKRKVESKITLKRGYLMDM